jgi:hypothetical protein
MSDQPFPAHFAEGLCVGTVAATVAAFLTHPMIQFAHIMSRTDTSVIQLARDTSMISLLEDAPKAVLRHAPAAGLALGAHEVLVQRLFGRDKFDPSATRFYKSCVSGAVAGAMEGAVSGAGPIAPRVALHSVYRGLFFGLDAAARPQPGSGYFGWVPQFVAGFYTTFFALMVTQPARVVVEHAEHHPSVAIAAKDIARRGTLAFFQGSGVNIFAAMRGSLGLLFFNWLRDQSPTL